MLISKNKIKHITSLKIKKYRDIHRQFIIEGDKIIRDFLLNKGNILQIIGLSQWLEKNSSLISKFKGEVFEADFYVLSKLSSLDTAPKVIAVAQIADTDYSTEEIENSVSIALENVQDPGNLGTIIRTADWFGIKHIFCSEGCADIYNSKVIQASMGSVLNIKIISTDLNDLFRKLFSINDFKFYGTFMEGESIFEVDEISKGLILFGNESKGISEKLSGIINKRITIPALSKDPFHVESLNVASSVGIVLATLLPKS